ncbi:MAG: FtsQ-type POTRA domain-containing protein [Thermoleophilia bacterium]|jgi:cell division septal protein FtsQ|nr:FtsQ-type POTRA domain-containing protein [Thermoleophilia bacterium]
MARHGGARGPRLHIFWSILLTVAVLAVPGAVVAWGRSTSTFTTERVAVTGAHMVAKKEARRALEGAFLGENLFAVTADDVRRVLRRQCYLADVEIDRDFPDTLRVRLIEHRPALAVLAEGRWFLVSSEGHVICVAPAKGASTSSGPAAAEAASSAGESAAGEDPSEAESDAAAASGDSSAAGSDAAAGTLDEGPAGKVEGALPRLPVAEKLTVGKAVGDARVQTAVAVLADVPRSLRRRMARVEVTRALRVTVTLRDGTVVRLGDAARLGDKVIALRAVTAAYRARGQRPTHVDVSVPERPLGRPLLK